MAGILKKLYISFLSALLYILLASPMTYGLASTLLSTNENPDRIAKNGCPTFNGHLLFTLLFFIISLIQMVIGNWNATGEENKSFFVLTKYSLYATLLFYFISNREVYNLTNQMLPETSIDGCPKTMGVLLHAFIFMLILFVVMLFPTG